MERFFERFSRRARCVAFLAALCPLFAALACTHNYSYTLGPQGDLEYDAFPAIRQSASEEMREEVVGVEVRVFHPSAEREAAAEALREVVKPIRFLAKKTGRATEGLVSFYLHRIGDAGTVPLAHPQGRGVYTGLFLSLSDRPLLTIDYNRRWFFRTYPHELAHHFLEGLPLADRWLEDGLAEYLASEFAREYDPEGFRGFRAWNPPIIALHRVAVESWTYSDFRAMEEYRESDPEQAFLVGSEELWRYSAAGELVRRWMEAARQRGVENPVRDLLDRIEARGNPVTMDAMRELAREQTGRSLESLASVDPAELARARHEAWDQRLAGDVDVRLHALRVLTFLGLPESVDASDLVRAIEIPDEALQPPLWSLIHATGMAIARGGEPEVASDFVRRVQELQSDVARRAIPPEIWRLTVETDRRSALDQLVRMVGNSDVPLEVRRRANQMLEEITGSSVGWSIDLGPENRRVAADRWRDIVGR